MAHTRTPTLLLLRTPFSRARVQDVLHASLRVASSCDVDVLEHQFLAFSNVADGPKLWWGIFLASYPRHGPGNARASHHNVTTRVCDLVNGVHAEGCFEKLV
ncbi:hypothetical protein B0H19DRAFT_1090874 [Mycena capillaripes]|nr:hypothetical protein B0H19DRAFT_1090874 [Mycena capillaripes]